MQKKSKKLAKRSKRSEPRSKILTSRKTIRTSDLCYYCLAEMAASYTFGANKEHYDTLLSKATRPPDRQCNCCISQLTAAGHCKCQCRCAGLVAVTTYRREKDTLVPVGQKYEQNATR